MPISPKLAPEVAQANMAEIAPRYTAQEAIIEANRCLFCFDAPCIQACPTGIDIPSFIKKIANGNLTAAARTILTANVLGASCARVCPTEVLCEGACVVLDREGEAVKIGRLQPYAGGLNTYGIAYYKMTPRASLEEVEMIEALGVEFRCGVEVGTEVSGTE